MARDEEGLGNGRSPLGTVLGVLLCILGFGSVVLWHANGGVFTSPMGWLMGDVSHTALEVGTVVVLLLGLVFAAFVSYTSRIAQDNDWPEPDPAPVIVAPVAPPPRRARSHEATQQLPRYPGGDDE